MRFADRGPFRQQEWIDEVEAPRVSFHQFGLPAKIRYLTDTFGVTALPTSVDLVLGMNRVRNCLVHRHGIVGAPDIGTDPLMQLRWKRMQLFAEAEGKERPIETGHVVESGEGISIRQIDASKAFALGERVTITPREAEETLWTSFLVSEDVRQCTIRYANERGVRDAEAAKGGRPQEDAGA